jgi:hypothetical protein
VGYGRIEVQLKVFCADQGLLSARKPGNKETSSSGTQTHTFDVFLLFRNPIGRKQDWPDDLRVIFIYRMRLRYS